MESRESRVCQRGRGARDVGVCVCAFESTVRETVKGEYIYAVVCVCFERRVFVVSSCGCCITSSLNFGGVRFENLSKRVFAAGKY